MSLTCKYPLTIATVFIWIGFVCAISFMEAWLKFRAPGITLSLGLGIGRLVFHALNKVELVFSVIVVSSILYSGIKQLKWQYVSIVICILIVFAQTLWLLPSLDIRAEMHIQGQYVPDSNIHFYYIGLELIKVVCLLLFGIKLFKIK